MRKTKKTAFMGIMLAIMLVLSAIEHLFPPLPLLPPGVRLGLSNIVTMYCVFFISKTEAAVLNAMKSLFVFLTRGMVAGILSFCGGMLSIIVVILALILFDKKTLPASSGGVNAHGGNFKLSYIAVGICGAVSHNAGQFIAASFIMDSEFFLYYLPVLLISGILMGVLTGTLLKTVLPVLKKVLK